MARCQAMASVSGAVTVYDIRVRPRSFRQALVVGTLYVDVATAELVRFRFSFTPAAYLDRHLDEADELCVGIYTLTAGEQGERVARILVALRRFHHRIEQAGVRAARAQARKIALEAVQRASHPALDIGFVVFGHQASPLTIVCTPSPAST